MSAFLDLGGFNPADYDLPVDARLVLSKEEMRSVGKVTADQATGRLLDHEGTPLISLPGTYFCICIDTKKLYSFNIANDWTEPFGKFREILGGGDVEVIPNPQESPSAKLRTLKINQVTYDVNSEELITAGAMQPTSVTPGEVGHLYIDSTAPKLYQCIQQDNSIILEDPGTDLPLCLGKSWEAIQISGIEKILSNGGAPTDDLAGVRGQLYVDTVNCEIYQCYGQISPSQYIWKLVSQSKGYTLTLATNSYAPYKVLHADGTWSVPIGEKQRVFKNAVAILLANNQTVTTTKGLLSQVYPNMADNKNGYTLISDTEVIIHGEV